jgi:hypothetical protein
VRCDSPPPPAVAPAALGAGPHGYRICVTGQLDQSWAETLGGLQLAWDEAGNTVLTAELMDQSALFGVLARLFDLGLLLVSVARLDDAPLPEHLNPLHEPC